MLDRRTRDCQRQDDLTYQIASCRHVLRVPFHLGHVCAVLHLARPRGRMGDAAHSLAGCRPQTTHLSALLMPRQGDHVSGLQAWPALARMPLPGFPEASPPLLLLWALWRRYLWWQIFWERALHGAFSLRLLETQLSLQGAEERSIELVWPRPLQQFFWPWPPVSVSSLPALQPLRAERWARRRFSV